MIPSVLYRRVVAEALANARGVAVSPWPGVTVAPKPAPPPTPFTGVSVGGTRTDPVILRDGVPVAPAVGAPAPSFLTASPDGVKQITLANSGTVADASRMDAQAQNRARLLQVVIAAGVIWLGFRLLDAKGR